MNEVRLNMSPADFWVTSKSKMKIKIRIALIVAIAVNPLQVLSGSSPVSFKGHWRVDLERSLVPNGPIPRRVTLNVITDNGRVYEAQETQVRADGTVITELVHVPINGKSYPILGSPNDIKVAITHWAPGSMRMELHAPSGLRGVETCRISIDLKTMTCDEIDTDLKGNTSSGRSVYVRSQ